jgi:sugar lactone lactonase YvrE
MRTRIFLTLTLSCTALLSPAQTPQFVISTLAGAPLADTPVPALSVAIGSPLGIATDTAGSVYFTSALQVWGGNGNTLLKLDQSGILTRMTGAQLTNIAGLVVDKSGNAYLAESGVVKVSSDGIVTTIAGGPGSTVPLNPSGLIAKDAAGNLYVSDYPQRIRKISLDGSITTVAGNGDYGFAGDGGPATSAQLGVLSGLAVDLAGNIYLSDNYYGGDDCDDILVYARVRMVSPDGTIRTVAGSGPGYSGDGGPAIGAQLMYAGALATDNAGNLYIADGARIRRISTDGTIITLAGSGSGGNSGDGGPATSALLGSVSGLAADSAGNLYIAEVSHIRKISPTGTISTVAGEDNPPGGVPRGDGGPAYTAILSAPTGVAVDSTGAVYIADTFGEGLRKVTSDGIIAAVAGTSWPLGPAGPSGLAIDSAGNLYIAEAFSGHIRKFSPDGVITTVAGSLQQAVEPDSSGDGGLATSARLFWPKDIALDGSGNLYIADTGNNKIRMVNAAGIITTIAGTGPAGYSGVGFSGDGGPAVRASLFLPSGIALDGSGNLYIADTNNYRVRKISPSGIISTLAGNGTRGFSGDGGPALQAQLFNPVGLKLDSAGNLYIADSTSVRMVSPAGIITTVAGTGVQGASGDGGPATKALLGAWGLAFDGAGDLYVADPWSNSVRVLRPAGQ